MRFSFSTIDWTILVSLKLLLASSHCEIEKLGWFKEHVWCRCKIKKLGRGMDRNLTVFINNGFLRLCYHNSIFPDMQIVKATLGNLGKKRVW